jgi:branched-chain amino acid aminotransferase
VKVWLNGSLCPVEDARISVLDHGLTVGDGVFETVKVLDGGPFALTRHLERLAASARGLGLPDPDLDGIRAATRAVLDAADDDTRRLARLRITLTGGPSPLGSERGGEPPTLVIAAVPLHPWPPSTAVATVPWVRNDRSAVAGLKTTSYAENVVALAHAHGKGAAEAIFANTRDQLCEGTGSNVFVVVGERLLTPPLSSGCLAGVTRALVLEWCGGEEADLELSVLNEADEVFLASTTRDLQPVHAVDGRPLVAPGPVTERAQKVFAARSAADQDP